MRMLLFLVLIFTINSSFAEWSKTLKIGDQIWYIDYSSIRKNEQLVKVWILADNINTKANLASSMEFLQEYDCREGRKRNLATIFFSDRMGSGKVIQKTQKSDEWDEIRFHTNNHASLISSLVCQSEWLKVFEDPRRGSFYFDPLSISRNGRLVSLWTLINFFEKDQLGALSVKHLYEYDCESLQTRLLKQTSHADVMALGDVITSALGGTPITAWKPIEAYVDKHMQTIVCE